MLATGLLPSEIPTGAPSQPELKLSPSPHDEDHPHRRHQLEEEKAALLGVRPAPIADVLPQHPPNVRRSANTLKVFCLTLFIMLDCFAVFAWCLRGYYRTHIEPRLSAPVVASDESLKKVQAALETKLQASLENLKATPPPVSNPGLAEPSTQLSLTDGQITRMQGQITALKTQQAQVDSQLKKLETPAPKPEDAKTTEQLNAALAQIDKLAAQLKKLEAPAPKTEDPKAAEQLNAALAQINQLQSQVDKLATQLKESDGKIKQLAEAPPSSPKTEPKEPSIATVVSVTSDAGQELRLLKERNRLTLYADQAMAAASSKAMASLWQTIRDPELAFVKDGAVAEIVRVQHFYSTMPGLPADYRLPVADLFKDTDLHQESDLKNEQIIKLLQDQSQPAEVRARCAMILTGHSEKRVGDALVSAMRHDASLLVVKAAQHSLQDTYELYGPRLFDSVGMETAWQEWQNKHAKPEAEPEPDKK